MKTIRKHLGIFCYMLTFTVLFQSCVVYHRSPVTLEQAAQAKTRSKIFADGAFAKYMYVTEINGEFYGVRKKQGMLVETALGNNPDTNVYLKNKSTSKWLTWGAIVYTAGAAALLIWFATSDWDIYQ